MPAPKPKDYGKKAPADIGLGLARSVGQGLLFGFGDEVEAFARSLVKGADYEDTLGIVREEIEQFRKEAPVAAYGAEIASSIPSFLLGGAGLARVGLTGAGKVGAIQSGLYGAGVGEDAEERAKLAGLSALTGGAISAAAGKILPKKSETAKKLQKKGIPLTPGQSLRDSGTIGSSLISALEDLTTSYPGAGAPIQAKRLETLLQTNRVILDEAVKPLKIKIPKNLSMKESYEYVDDVISKEYENVISRLSIKGTNNLQQKIFNNIENSILDDLEQARVLRILDKKMLNKIKDDQISGRDLKNIQTELRRLGDSFSKKGGAEGEIGQVIKETKKILEDEIDLQNIDSQALKNVNKTYANLIPINDAMQQAIIQEGVFTPAQLIRAIKKTDPTKRKAALLKGDKPLLETATQAQQVLGSQFPDSGTASRLLAQDVIVNPLKLGKLAPPAIASELLMSRPFGMSPVTGLLTSVSPLTRGATPASTAILLQQAQEEEK